ncbi:MAG TPA: hypothetical protein VMS31_01795 [Pyrinomonadaceae bacterium]|nr:hypothetical protein [Pyrinomonadaceae bacterium]
MISASYATPEGVKRLQQRALIVGLVFLVIFAVGFFVSRAQFFHSYLFAFSFWVGISIGSLALLMLQHLTGGGWGLVIRRVLEAATQTLPLMLVLFVPIVLGAHWLYRWTDAEEVASHPVLAGKAKYLNLPFFTIRGVIFFAIWITLAFFLRRWSNLQDRTAERQYAKRMTTLAGPGMVLMVFAVTFASIDWFMSLEPEWYSTIYGFIFLASWTLSALAFVVAVMAALARQEPMNRIVAQMHFHDLGKLLLALVMLWSYFAFSQFLIVWSGNLPEEIHWYLPRIKGAWGAMALVVIVLHFAFPFLFLLSRSFKRNAGKLVIVALLILVMRLFDLFWTIVPSFTHEHFHVSWMDIVAPIGMGGLWLALFARALSQRPLIPINDPQYESVLEQKHAHAGH